LILFLEAKGQDHHAGQGHLSEEKGQKMFIKSGLSHLSRVRNSLSLNP